MSLASLIREQMVPVVKCKTCIALRRLPEEDRVEFEAARGQVPGSILCRALTARLAELGIDETAGESSVRLHIRERHGL